jgi:hypothetical protein
MKNIFALSTIIILLTSCASPINKIEFGKKCIAKGDRVTYSYVWFFNDKVGLDANKKDCELIEDKK